MPHGFAFPLRELDGWRPVAETADSLQTRAQHFLEVVGRLKPGASLADAAATSAKSRYAAQKQYPGTNDQRGVTLAPLHEAIAGELRAPMLLLGGAVAILLMIGAVNVANLMLVEATARRREIALRSAVGADRFRIVRQLSSKACCSRCSAEPSGGPRLGRHHGHRTAAVDYIPRADAIAMDGRVSWRSHSCLSAVTGIVFAIAPALLAARADVQHDLREGARGIGRRITRLRAPGVRGVRGRGRARHRRRPAARSFWNLRARAAWYATEHVLTATVELPRAMTPARRLRRSIPICSIASLHGRASAPRAS